MASRKKIYVVNPYERSKTMNFKIIRNCFALRKNIVKMNDLIRCLRTLFPLLKVKKLINLFTKHQFNCEEIFDEIIFNHIFTRKDYQSIFFNKKVKNKFEQFSCLRCIPLSQIQSIKIIKDVENIQNKKFYASEMDDSIIFEYVINLRSSEAADEQDEDTGAASDLNILKPPIKMKIIKENGIYRSYLLSK